MRKMTMKSSRRFMMKEHLLLAVIALGFVLSIGWMVLNSIPAATLLTVGCVIISATVTSLVYSVSLLKERLTKKIKHQHH